MAAPKGKMAVRKAVKEVYGNMPRFQKFSLMGIHASVVRLINRPYLYLDTSRRKLFEMREEKEINFVCISKSKSLYQKL